VKPAFELECMRLREENEKAENQSKELFFA
jgi:hypothetical protein